MSKVLLVEPHKVLQQALALSLFPEHDVRVQELIDAGAVATLADADLLIIDAAALREKGELTADLQRAVEASNIAVLWIDESASVPKRDRLAAIGRPVANETLQSAVIALLTGAPVKAPAKKRGEAKSAKAAAPEEPESQPIDLVEVVEEGPEGTK